MDAEREETKRKHSIYFIAIGKILQPGMGVQQNGMIQWEIDAHELQAALSLNMIYIL